MKPYFKVRNEKFQGWENRVPESKSKKRLSRTAWLAEALDALAEDPTHLRIDEIARRLGVSKGSFYWHFESRENFVNALAEYWREAETKSVVEALQGIEGGPDAQLRELMRVVVTKGLARYDLAVRAWARIEPGISPIVQEVDNIRVNTVRALFSELGFKEPELSLRTRVFVIYHSFDDALTIPPDTDNLEENINARIDFFTRR